MARYLSIIANRGNLETAADPTKEGKETKLVRILKYMILKEIFSAGCLTKKEITRHLLSATSPSKLRIMKAAQISQDPEILASLVDQICDEFTLDHILVGASTNQEAIMEQASGSEDGGAEESKVTG